MLSGLLSSQHGAPSGQRWRGQPQDMKASHVYK